MNNIKSGEEGDFQPNTDDSDRLNLVRTITHSTYNDGADNNVLTRLSTLSQKISHLTATEMDKLSFDKEDFDLQTVLHYIKCKSEEKGLAEKTTAVELENVTVYGVDDSVSIVPTLLSLLRIFKRGNKQQRKILCNINALVEEGEMCLVLGRPGAGCSSFLKTVAGETDQFIHVDGDISYNSIPQKLMMKNFKRDIIYNPELDVHFPHLTVDQTLKFAIGCRTPALRFDYSRSKYIEIVRDLWATVFGLTHTYNTKVGNEFVRGISGGERKRVSIAEAMVAQGSVYCWDNATRGLDASTALEYLEAIRISTNLMKTTSFVTIYQASENIYEIFDKVTILYEGRQIFFGSTYNAKIFFTNMGFECPPRQSTAEFLTAITDPFGRIAKTDDVPKTALEFELRWLASNEYHELKLLIAKKKQITSLEDTIKLFHLNMVQERMKGQLLSSRYTVNFIQQLKLCTIRSVQNIIGDKAYTITMFAAALIHALIEGSLFYNLPNSTLGAFLRGGVAFSAVLYFTLMGLAEVSTTFAERPILMKQKGYSFYHPSATVLASTITQFPMKLIVSIIFSVILYFLANLKVDAGAFFIFLLFINLTAQAIAALFQLTASVTKTFASANALSGLALVCSVLYCSYLVQRPSMVVWFKWISYLNPLLYGFELIITNEFHGRKMSCPQLVPSGPAYTNISLENQVCGFTASNGKNFVDGDFYIHSVYQYTYSHVWRNLGILITFWIGFLILNCIASENIRPMKSGGDHLSFIKKKKLDIEMGELPDDREMTIAHKLGSDEIFAWKNIDYIIPYKGSERKLLDNVQGYVKPGTLTALMGESGAGKTTSLNVLSQRVDIGVVTGDMLVNGNTINESFKRRTGYVQQQDIHVAELTVRESLQFAAKLRRPLSVPESEKLEYVEKVIEILQMEEYADAIAGKSGDGLNVEQRKKLSIGTELVAKPELLLFLDEPTSGLDSQSAWSIVQILRALANAGQAILCTIHQPSATLFEAFDRLLLLRKGGQTVYFGDIGENSKTIIDYFETNGARKCDISENPAEYILELIGAGATASSVENWFDKWTNSKQFKDTTDEIEMLIKDVKPEREISVSTFAMPYSYQFKTVLVRTFIQFYRDLNYIMSKFLLLTFAGLILGFSIYDVKHTVVGMQNAVFAIFGAIILSAPLSNQIQDKAISSRELYEVRESKSNTFHWSTLLLSQLLNEIPLSCVCATVFFVSSYFPIHFNSDISKLGLWWFIYCIFFQLYYVSVSLWVVYMAPDLPSANAINMLFLAFSISFCGVIQPVSLMPSFWTFMYKVSPHTYFIQSLVALVLHDRKVHCSEIEMSVLKPPQGLTCGEYLDPFLQYSNGYISNPNSTTICKYCPYAVADEYMETVGIKYSYRWRNVGFYCVYIMFNMTAMLGMYYFFRVLKISKLRLRNN